MAAVGPSRWPHLADRSVIVGWANRTEARANFPRLIRHLIRQTNDQVVTLQIRAEEGTGLPGYDGIVEAGRGSPFVPDGKSVWELGTGSDPEDKANRDYRSRTKDPLGVDQVSTTFVFATPREWRSRDEWAAKKRAEEKWKDVRAFDVDDIYSALEAAPGAHVWFSDSIGMPASSVQIIGDWWERFGPASSPALTPELILAGRVDAAAELLRILNQDPQVTSISAASTDDLLAFVAATILASQEDMRIDLLGRTLIVRDSASLRQLETSSGLLILLPFDEELYREAQLIRGHHLVILAPPDTPAHISLPPIEKDEFRTELGKLGVTQNLDVLANAAHRSILAFQRTAPAPGRVPRADWVEALGNRVVRRAWLAGAWTERLSGDIDALALLVGMPYEGIRDTLMPVAQTADPVIVVAGDSWTVADTLGAWEQGHRHVQPQDLGSLETTVQNVLGAVDPALELPIEDRWQASIYGKARVHSSELRRGLATTLALFGTYGDSVNLGAGRTAQSAAQGIVASLLRRANEDLSGDLWVSLADALPLLAEAAPDLFLRSIQEGVAGPDPLLRKMFLDKGGEVLSVSSPHTGLLWALETLAWSQDYLGLVVNLLGQLAEIDPGGRLSNRPLNSIQDILRPWMPQTGATVERRLAVLDALQNTHPDIAWKVLRALAPQYHDVGRYTHTPVFRDWKAVNPDNPVDGDDSGK